MVVKINVGIPVNSVGSLVILFFDYFTYTPAWINNIHSPVWVNNNTNILNYSNNFKQRIIEVVVDRGVDDSTKINTFKILFKVFKIMKYIQLLLKII